MTQPKRPVLLVLAGPAGSGKSTLCDRLVDARMGFTRVVTSTTRSPRSGEVNGVHYHFFTPEEFDRRVQKGEFRAVEAEARFGSAGQQYTTAAMLRMERETIGQSRSS